MGTPDMAETDDGICVGRFGKPHGIRGLIKLVSYCADEGDIAGYCPLLTRPGGREITLSISHKAGGSLVARVEGVRSRRDAAALSGQELLADRASFPAPDDEEYYHVDLIGLAAKDGNGAHMGHVETVANFGASDLLVIKKTSGKTVMITFQELFVPEVNLAGGYVRICIDPENQIPIPERLDQ